MFSIILYSYKLYCCHICDISQLWSYAPGFTQSICQKIFQTVSHATYNISPSVKLFHLFISNVNLVFELGNAFIGTLVWDSNDGHTGILSQNPNISNFPNQIKTTKQGRKSHATSLTKEPYFFVAVEQPSIFKPCQKFTASPHSLAT